MKHNEAQNCYEEAVARLKNYCDEETELTAEIIEAEYPFRVKFVPDYQLTMFDSCTGEPANVDTETGEIKDPGELTITVGLTTTVKSTLTFKMDSKMLKKLIKLAETVGTLYYHAFRERAGDLRQDNEVNDQLREVMAAAEAAEKE